jgi:hypothetical protein
VRAAVGADADQVEGLRAVPGLGCRVMFEQHERGPYPRASPAQICPADSGDRGRRAGLGDHGQPAGLTTGRQPHPEVSNALPVGEADRVPPERLVGDELTERSRADPMEPALTGGNASLLLSATIVSCGGSAEPR